LNRAAAAWNDRDDPGGAEAAPARRKEQPRSSRLDESRRAELAAAWRAGMASATSTHGRSGDEPGHGEPGDREAPLARQPEARQSGDQLSPDAARLLLMIAMLQLQRRLTKRRARLKNRRPAHVARPIMWRGKRQRRSKNSIALNKIVTWRPASQEISGEKGPKRQWGLPIAGNGGMCAEQRADYQAACDGKIAWSVYFAKWGPKL
jgi:hypothetical protein